MNYDGSHVENQGSIGETSWQKKLRFLGAFVLVAGMLISASPVKAKTVTGSDLLYKCEDKKDFFNRGFCTGFINGAWEIITGNGLACSPKGSTLFQIKRIVIKYLKDHPERLHYIGAVLIHHALAHTFPCKR
jgi:hypothetical protein